MSRSEIRCLPRGVCAWTFQLKGREHEAVVELRGLRDHGRVVIDGEHDFDVTHDRWLGRTWTLLGADGSTASAEKLPMRRIFELKTLAGHDLRLRPESLFARGFVLEDGSQALATIRTDHAFTRRATIAVERRGLDFPTACFAFWLAAMTWRRRRRNN